MIESPPKINFKRLNKFLLENKNNNPRALVNKINEKYEYWSDIKYKKLPANITPEQLWDYVKYSRMMNSIIVWKKYNIQFSNTTQMSRLCHQFDMNFGGSWGSDSLISEKNKEQYLISSLMEEAISSSQIEGASTTKKVAKEMLRKSISPKNISQQMILNNYQTIQFITEHKDTPLSEDLLLHIHKLMTNKTLDNNEDAGKFRTKNNVIVENGITHEVVHTPPSYKDLPEFSKSICDFFNEDNSQIFIHPVIRGIIIHFMIAYMHPFVDGNGRTARALFYWYMLKQGYWLTEYLSISRIISKSKRSYEKAYLYTEEDEMDLGYFVTYNLRVLNTAFLDLQHYINRKSENKIKASIFYTLGNLNERQADILKLVSDTPKIMLTIKELQNRFVITHATAKSDIIKLVKRNLIKEIPLNKVKKGYIKGDKFDETINTL